MVEQRKRKKARNLVTFIGAQHGKLAGVKIVKLQRSKTHLSNVSTFLVTYLILLDIYVKLLN